jgi:hypothetical protein
MGLEFFPAPVPEMTVLGVLAIPATRGPMIPANGVVLSRGRLATDSIGNTTVTFQGINANSEIRVYLPDGTEAAGVELCDANHVLTWGVYSPGSANNTVRVVVVHPDYKIKEFDYTAAAGNASLPIQQELDRWYSNPI